MRNIIIDAVIGTFGILHEIVSEIKRAVTGYLILKADGGVLRQVLQPERQSDIREVIEVIDPGERVTACYRAVLNG